MHISDYIKLKRKRAKKTQEQLAEDLGYKTGQFISNWERGIAMPPARKIRELSEALNVKSAELVKLYLKSKTHHISDKIKGESCQLQT